MSARPLLVVPPPGPLCWLYPALAQVEPPPARFAGDVLDLRVEPARGAALRERLTSSGARDLVVPAGRLGATLARALRQLLRGRPATVRLHASAEPLTIEDRLARAVAGPLQLDARTRALLVEPSLAGLERARQHGAPGTPPVFATPPPGDDPDVTTRLPCSWWGVLPGERYAAPVRAAARELVQALVPECAPVLAALETWALCGFDLYLEALLGRLAASPPARPQPRRPLVLAICGIDGSGKSSHVAALAEHLTGRGLRVQVHKLYRHGLFHQTTTDLARLCTDGQHLHLWRLERIAKVFDSVKHFAASVEPGLGACDVALFDRYDLTHFAAARARYAFDPCARELLALLPRPHAAFLLDAPAEQALARIGGRGQRTIDENPYMLARYREGYLDLADCQGPVVLDATRPFAHNQAAIRAVVEPLLAGVVP